MQDAELPFPSLYSDTDLQQQGKMKHLHISVFMVSGDSKGQSANLQNGRVSPLKWKVCTLSLDIFYIYKFI